MIKGKQIEPNTITQDRLEPLMQDKLNNSVLENDFNSVSPPNGSIQQYNSTLQKWEAVSISTGYVYFPVWAEENSSLNPGNNGGFQWAYGNGATTSQSSGITVGVDCELYSINLSSVTTTSTGANIGVYRNSTLAASSGIQSNSNAWSFVLSTPEAFSADDIVNIETIAGGGGTSVRVTLWFRYQIPGLIGPQGLPGTDGANFNDQLFGSGVPLNSLGLDGDIYFDNDTGDLYKKLSNVWSIQLNLTGPTGPAGADGTNFNDQLFGSGVPLNSLGSDGDIYFDNNTGDLYKKITGNWLLQQNIAGGGVSIKTIEVTNTAQTNLNNSATGTDFTTINLTPIFNNSASSVYSVQNDGIEVLADGDYEVYCNIYQTSTVQRSNVGIRFTIDNVVQNVISASSYIRSTGNHNEASTNLKQTFSLTVNQKIGIRFFQLASAGTVTMPANNSIFSIKKIA